MEVLGYLLFFFALTIYILAVVGPRRDRFDWIITGILVLTAATLQLVGLKLLT